MKSLKHHGPPVSHRNGINATRALRARGAYLLVAGNNEYIRKYKSNTNIN